jgi:hypothetical protein
MGTDLKEAMQKSGSEAAKSLALLALPISKPSLAALTFVNKRPLLFPSVFSSIRIFVQIWRKLVLA